MGLDLVACLDHRVGHALEDCSMAAGVDCGHSQVFLEGEFFHSQSFVKIFSLNVLSDSLVADWSSVFLGCAEKHPGSVVVLVVNNVHFVVPEVFFVLFEVLGLPSLQHDDFIFALFHWFFL